MKHLLKPGYATFLLGGQWGSEGKGSAAAYLTKLLCEHGRMFDVVTANNGAQSGHTSVHAGKKRVAFHLPTAPLIAREYGQRPWIYLNGGAVIDPDVLMKELAEFGVGDRLLIHPFAAVITPECKEAEARADSAQTKIASTRKGVGEALSRKVLRSGMVAKDHPYLKQFVSGNVGNLSNDMANGRLSVLVEVPQGIGLSIDGGFYPHCTSRNCTVGQAMADAGIHPKLYGGSMLVLRTYPIRVGNIKVPAGDGVPEWRADEYSSGGCYPDQLEISWELLGVEAEITTVTKRVRRVFTFSREQLLDAMAATRPEVIMLTFCNYPHAGVNQIAAWISEIAYELGFSYQPQVWYQYGPTTDDVRDAPL